MIDLDKLEELARAATSGPWTPAPPVGDDAHDSGGERYHWTVRCPSMPPMISHQMLRLSCVNHNEQNDAQFIAAANPAAVLGLIALVRQAAEPAISEQPKGDTVAIPMVSGEKLVAHAAQQVDADLPPLPREDGTIGGMRYWNAYSVQQQVRTALAQHAAQPVRIPHGWRIERNPVSGVISVQSSSIGGYATHPDDENIASSILPALAADMIATQPVQQPASVAPADLVDAICHTARVYGSSETFRPQLESLLRQFWPAGAHAAPAPAASVRPDTHYDGGRDAALRVAVGKLISAKGSFHTAQNYAAVVAAFNAVTAAATTNQETST